MKIERTIIYIIALIHVVGTVVSGLFALGALKKITPYHLEYEVLSSAAMTLMQPAVFTIMIAYLISCVDHD